MVKKIDIHVHTTLFKGPLRMGTNYTFATPEELIDIYDSEGIEKGFIQLRLSPEATHVVQSNEEIKTIVDKYPDRFGWFCSIDPRMGNNTYDCNLSYFLEYYKSMGAKGVGEISCNLYFDDLYVQNLLYHCEKQSMPVIFQIAPHAGGTYGLIDDLGLPRLEKVLKKFPNLKFFGHSQAFWSEISSDVTNETRHKFPSGKIREGRVVELFEKYENLYGDLSAGSGFNAVARDPNFGYSFIEKFQDRLMFGTDISTPQQRAPLAGWLDEAVNKGNISEEAYLKVSRENAIRILGL